VTPPSTTIPVGSAIQPSLITTRVFDLVSVATGTAAATAAAAAAAVSLLLVLLVLLVLLLGSDLLFLLSSGHAS